MNLLAPRPKWFDEWFPDWNPGYMMRPLHGDPMPSQIKVDVSETDEAYQVKAELAGVKRDDIDVQIKDGVVSISAEVKQEDRETKDDRVLRSERYFGRVSRSFSLPVAIDTNACQASFEDGILSLLLPKTAPTENHHKIEIS